MNPEDREQIERLIAKPVGFARPRAARNSWASYGSKGGKAGKGSPRKKWAAQNAAKMRWSRVRALRSHVGTIQEHELSSSEASHCQARPMAPPVMRSRPSTSSTFQELESASHAKPSELSSITGPESCAKPAGCRDIALETPEERTLNGTTSTQA